MVAHHIVETEDWDNEEALSAEVDVSDVGSATFAGYHFAGGFAAIKRGEAGVAAEALNAILERLDSEGGDSNERKAAGVMASELVALIDLVEGNIDLAIESLRDAADSARGPFIQLRPA